MSEKIRVTYATRLGATAGVAEAIGKTLAETGLQVDVIEMQAVRDLSPYRAVILGSAVQKGALLPEALEFIRSNQAELRQKPIAAYLVCLTLAIQNGKYLEQVKDFMQPLRSLVKPLSEGYFAGVLDIHKVPALSDRIKFRISVLTGVWTERDHRDWDAIRLWAQGLPGILLER